MGETRMHVVLFEDFDKQFQAVSDPQLGRTAISRVRRNSRR